MLVESLVLFMKIDDRLGGEERAREREALNESHRYFGFCGYRPWF